jgi:hypothetical protein
VEGSRVTYTIRLRSALHRKAHGQLALYGSDACRSLVVCALGHDRCTRLRPDNGVPQMYYQESSLRRRAKSRL